MHTYPYQLLETNRAITRLPAMCVAAGTITLGLFVMMEALTRQEGVVHAPDEPIAVFNPIFEAKPEETIHRQTLPEREEPKPRPEVVKMVTPQAPAEGTTFKMPNIPKTSTERIVNQGLGLQDGSPRELVRIQPEYPIDAARRGIQGWVMLSFSIDANGKVSDVSVIDAEPKRVFNQAAKKALRRWQYRPAVSDGKPTATKGHKVVLEFNLDKSV